MRALGVLLLRRAIADEGPAADQRRLVRIDRGRHQGGLDRLGIVAVDLGDHFPAIGLEAPRGVVGEPARDPAIDRDPVVVVDRDQLAELERAGQRAGFVRDALHQAAVAHEHVGVVVDDREPGPVVALREQLLGQRHADRVGEALAQRAGGGLDRGMLAGLRVSGRLRVQLAEALELGHRQVVAGQVQQRVQQHRAVAVGQHEAIAVGPARLRRIVAQEVVPQHLGDVGHAHRHAGVAGIGLLDGIHGQRTDGVREFGTARHAGNPGGVRRRGRPGGAARGLSRKVATPARRALARASRRVAVAYNPAGARGVRLEAASCAFEHCRGAP